MYTVKANTVLIRVQDVEHKTESGIIIDREDDKMISHGIAELDANVCDPDTKIMQFIPKGSHIIYSKDKVTLIDEDLGVVECKNIVIWEEPELTE